MEKHHQSFDNDFTILNSHHDSFAILLISTFFSTGILFAILLNNTHMATLNFILAMLLFGIFSFVMKLDFIRTNHMLHSLVACIAIQTLALLCFFSEHYNTTLIYVGNYHSPIFYVTIISVIILLLVFVVSITRKFTMYIRHLGNIAFEDPVTKLPNWCYFYNIIANRLKIHRTKRLLMAIWEIHNLDALNSNYGISHGNAILKTITLLLKQQLPNNASLTRDGGRKFIIIVPNWTEFEFNACITKCFEELTAISTNRQISCPVNIIAYDIFNFSDITLSAIFKLLNFTLLHAKSHGQVGIVKHEATVSENYEMEDLIISSVENAIENGDFEIKFQGKLNITTNRVCGFEALTRWKGDIFNGLSPGYFVPIINQSMYMIIFNEHILTLSMQKFNEIQACSYAQLSLSLNVSPLYLLHEDFPRAFERIALSNKVPLEHIVLEITEDALIRDYEKAKLHINLLRSKGVRFSLDDFGTGFSSLCHLSYLDIQELKLDKSIVQSAINCNRTLMLINGISKLAENMGCDLVAEGVECEDHYHMAKRIGCTQVQGYYIDLPSTSDHVKTKIVNQDLLILQ